MKTRRGMKRVKQRHRLASPETLDELRATMKRLKRAPGKRNAMKYVAYANKLPSRVKRRHSRARPETDDEILDRMKSLKRAPGKRNAMEYVAYSNQLRN